MTDKVTGHLEVGLNEHHEIVVNHPDLHPDEDGVGHIVFSPNQARNLASLLMKHASEAESLVRQQEEAERHQAAAAIPVDRSAQTLTDGSPVTEDHREINPATGQQKGYVVLSAAERAKGFVRPYRDSYVHRGIRPRYPLRDLTPEEHGRYKEFGYVKYEEYPEDSDEAQRGTVGRLWTEKDLKSGCGGLTTMCRSIAETYARDPKFYGGTFCVHCQAHFPLEQFVWTGTDQIMGS